MTAIQRANRRQRGFSQLSGTVKRLVVPVSRRHAGERLVGVPLWNGLLLGYTQHPILLLCHGVVPCMSANPSNPMSLV